MRYQILISVFSLASAWSRHAAFAPKGANCLDYIIPLTVTSDNRPWTGPRWEDDFGFIDFLSSASTRFSAGFPSPVGDPVKQTCSYEISATFCTPQRPGNHSKTVLLATHGLGFDKRYVSGHSAVSSKLTCIFPQLLELPVSARTVQFRAVCYQQRLFGFLLRQAGRRTFHKVSEILGLIPYPTALRFFRFLSQANTKSNLESPGLITSSQSGFPSFPHSQNLYALENILQLAPRSLSFWWAIPLAHGPQTGSWHWNQTVLMP